MRLFVGIRLASSLKDDLYNYSQTLTAPYKQAKDNYHLTLVYLGDTTKEMKKALDEALTRCVKPFSPFTVTLKNTGSFKKGSRYIVYIDVEDSDPLTLLRTEIKDVCLSLGFTLDPRPFKPHITLAKKVKTLPDLAPIDKTISVIDITLFLSHHENGDLVYTPLKHYPLK